MGRTSRRVETEAGADFLAVRVQSSTEWCCVCNALHFCWLLADVFQHDATSSFDNNGGNTVVFSSLFFYQNAPFCILEPRGLT